MNIALVTTFGTAALNGLVWVSAALAADLPASGVIHENTLVPIGVACACAVALATIVWKAATAFQQLSDRIGALERDIAELKDSAGGKR